MSAISSMSAFGTIVMLTGLAAIAAVFSNRLSDRLRIPAPGIFLIAASAASQFLSPIGRLSPDSVRNVVTLALILVLFNGGLEIGWRTLRPTVRPVLVLGLAGTVATAGALALALHYVLGLAWTGSLLVATALAPTDPAAVFSALGRRDVVGRAGTLLRGEAGANDPVGIALMGSLLGAGGTASLAAFGAGAGTFTLQLVVGAAVGIIGGRLLLLLMRRVMLSDEGLYPLQALFAVLVIFGAATVADGSGFLAVFLAGIAVADAAAPYKLEVERFHRSLASLGEIVAFTVLGLSVPLGSLAQRAAWLTGLAVAAILAVLVRPLVLAVPLRLLRLRSGERIFIAWSGLKGAVPILLGTLILASRLPDRRYLLHVIFVVVTFSVIVQGGTIPLVARWCRVPMRIRPLAPWAVGIRVRNQPHGLRRFRVQSGAPVVGRLVRDISRDYGLWVSLLSRNGNQIRLTRDTTVCPGDEILVATDPDQDFDPSTYFTAPADAPSD